MTKAEILLLVKNLTQDQADSVTIDDYFNQVLDDLGRVSDDTMTEMEVIPLTEGTEEYTLPDNAVIERAIFFDNHELRHTTVKQLEARSKSWRAHRGRPWAYSKDEQTARVFRVYPIPDFSSTATDWSEGEPLGRGFPSDALTIFYSSRRNDKIPTWLVLPLVTQILAYEFARPSGHQAEAFAQLCQQLTTVFFKFLDVDWIGEIKPSAGDSR